jgi:hypothetical protein
MLVGYYRGASQDKRNSTRRDSLWRCWAGKGDSSPSRDPGLANRMGSCVCDIEVDSIKANAIQAIEACGTPNSIRRAAAVWILQPAAVL